MAIQQRSGKDIWQSLYEFPMVEASDETPVKKIIQQALTKKWLEKEKYELISVSPLYKQQLSHQLIAGQFIKLKLKKKPAEKNWMWLSKSELKKHAFPQFINQYLKEGIQKQVLF